VRRPASPRSAERSALVRIERVGADGDGVGSYVAPSPNPLPQGEGASAPPPPVGGGREEGSVYIPLTLPGETVRARVAGQRGTLDGIVGSSPARTEPPCPHFGTCGGCTLQHWRDADYLAWKSIQLEAALRRAGFSDLPLSGAARTPPGARRRMDFALRRTASGVAIGLHRLRSTDVIDLQTCLVLHPTLLGLIAPLRTLLVGLTLLRREGSAIAHLLDSGPDLLLRTDAEPSTSDRAALADFARSHGIARIHWAKGNGVPEPVCILRPANVNLAGVPVTPPPGAFAQASAEGEQAIVAAVRAGLPPPRGARARVVELFAGCGTITFALSALARVTAYEGDVAAVAGLRQAANRAGLAGQVEAVQRDLARQLVSAKELARADAVVLDPPHAGAAPQMPAIAAARPERVIYVSCNPAALARDAAVLRQAGYRLTAITLIDQFLWSARIESVCVFATDTPKRQVAR